VTISAIYLWGANAWSTLYNVQTNVSDTRTSLGQQWRTTYCQDK